MDFTADGRTLLASCEFADRMIVVDVAGQTVLRTIPLTRVAGGMPQDVKLSPDGRVFYVADMVANGACTRSTARPAASSASYRPGRAPTACTSTAPPAGCSSPTGARARCQLLDLAARRVAATWRIPGGGSPDMGGVSADGRVLWLSGRYDGVVYAIRPPTATCWRRSRSAQGPHGLCVWPQPGRYSLGHTGILR